MAILHIRNVPDELYELMQAIATERKLSLSALVIELMEQTTTWHMNRKRHLSALTRMRHNMTKGEQTAISGADLVRAFRDEQNSVHD